MKVYRALEWPTDLFEIMRLLREDCNRLKVFRVALGWGQAEAAAWVGVSTATWNKWENGAGLRGEHLSKIALKIKDMTVGLEA